MATDRIIFLYSKYHKGTVCCESTNCARARSTLISQADGNGAEAMEMARNSFFRLKQNYDATIWIYATQFEIHRGKKTTSLYKRAWWWSFERPRLITYIILWHHFLLNGPRHGQRTAHSTPTPAHTSFSFTIRNKREMTAAVIMCLPLKLLIVLSLGMAATGGSHLLDRREDNGECLTGT